MTYRDLIGTPFKVHGRNKEEGYDCYGLAMEVLKRNGLALPEIPYNTSEEGTQLRDYVLSMNALKSVQKPEKNCIIEIEIRHLPLHIAVYLGEGMIIHATWDMGVIIEPLRKYQKQVRGYYKV